MNELPNVNKNAFLSLNVDNQKLNFGESNIRVLRFYTNPLSPS